MKIYIGKHSINNVDDVVASDEIPLAYIDSEFVDETITTIVENKFAKSTKTEVLPYDTFGTLDVALYDKNERLIALDEYNSILSRQASGQYEYIPKQSTSFSPYSFNYKVLAKKNVKYSSSRKYNINVCLVDGHDELYKDSSLSDVLMNVFSDSYQRKTCPSNIVFNHGDLKRESLLNGSYHDTDFLFINMGNIYNMNNEEYGLLLDELFPNNVVPVLITNCMEPRVETDLHFQPVKNKEEIEKEFTLKKYEVNKCDSLVTTQYFYVPQDRPGVKYHNIFTDKLYTPLIIEERINKGFSIIVTDEMMANLHKEYKLFYEVLLYVYLRTYTTTKTITEWITDVMPDYVVTNGRLTQKSKFTSHVELHKLLGLREGEVEPVEVIINQDGEQGVVFYTGMSSNYLVFRKVATPEHTDPKKNSSQMSIFTSKKDVIFCKDFVYTMQDNMENKLESRIVNGALSVKVKAFKSSELNIRNSKDITLNLTLDNILETQTAYLVLRKADTIKDLKLTFSINEGDVLIATFSVNRTKKESKIYDMRTKGGGLPDTEPDNYNCLDIGNILGRPYRKGATLITKINLPLRYKEMHDKIYPIVYESVRSNMIADDYLVLKINYK